MPVAATVLAAGAGALVVTVGARGAVYFGTGGRADGRTGGPVRTALVPAPSVEALDPTGCGDVFGATCCARMLAGDQLEAAVATANAAAARNATYRGATGLAGFLRGAGEASCA
jgi:sugar/nucleoside kinase (ribokinase family)